MSQRYVENFIGRLATDRELRLAFAADPDAALESYRNEGHELGSVELGALSQIDIAAIDRFADTLDQRLRRLGASGVYSAIQMRRTS